MNKSASDCKPKESKLAACTDDLAIVRSMSTGLNNHGPGQFLMHTGYRSSVAINYPSLGAIVAKECGQSDLGLPSYINLGGGSVPARFQRSGALGSDFAPMMLKGSPISDLKPPIAVREQGRLRLLEQVQQAESDRFKSEQLRSHAASYRKAIELMHTDKTRAFNYKDEPKDIQELYGSSGFGTQCLQARRLVEAGVAFVEVNWGGWDHHGGAAEPLKKRSPALDQGFSALANDLKQRGLLDTTLVVWMGEFGRGPLAKLGGGNNGHKGAGHYAKCWTTVLAGAGLKTGQVIGKTTPDCVDVAERPVSAGDFFATICKALDIDHEDTYEAAGRSCALHRNGKRADRGAVLNRLTASPSGCASATRGPMATRLNEGIPKSETRNKFKIIMAENQNRRVAELPVLNIGNLNFGFRIASLALGLLFAPAFVIADEDVDFFESRIRPVLVEHCYQCHSVQAQRQGKLRAELLLDSRAGMRKGGESGPAVVAGNSAKSLLLAAVRHESFEMPPKDKLPDAVIADFARWIEMGAPDPRDGTAAIKKDEINIDAGRRFWSLRSIKRPDVPTDAGDWARTEIDGFVLQALAEDKLKPVEDADPIALVRRLYFDLVGLPPPPAEIDTFQQAVSRNPNSTIESLVDRLLDSPQFGERWGRHWLDVGSVWRIERRDE